MRPTHYRQDSEIKQDIVVKRTTQCTNLKGETERTQNPRVRKDSIVMHRKEINLEGGMCVT